MSVFAKVALAPADPILKTALEFKADQFEKKVNLGIGAYRTEEGKPYVLPVVIKAEEKILAATGTKIDKEYLPIDGLAENKALTQALVFGKADARICTAQSLSGTGSLRMAGEFLRKHMMTADGPIQTVYLPDPTWGNHAAIFKEAGLSTATYPYYKPSTRGFDFEAMLQHMKDAPNGSVYLLHACAHNPTGVDPTSEQWDAILQLMEDKKHFAIMDSAYQGYASGDLVQDRFVIERMYNSGVEFIVCQSFSKNLGLYGERIGFLHVVCENADVAACALSQLKLVSRAMFSNPPCHGALLVREILGDDQLYADWCKELKEMAERIHAVRSSLRLLLEKKETPGTWNHITDQIGMFSFTGLSPEQCEKLVQEHHIYLLKSGRISLAGINNGNVEYVAECINKVVKELPSA